MLGVLREIGAAVIWSVLVVILAMVGAVAAFFAVLWFKRQEGR